MLRKVAIIINIGFGLFLIFMFMQSIFGGFIEPLILLIYGLLSIVPIVNIFALLRYNTPNQKTKSRS